MAVVGWNKLDFNEIYVLQQMVHTHTRARGHTHAHIQMVSCIILDANNPSWLLDKGWIWRRWEDCSVALMLMPFFLLWFYRDSSDSWFSDGDGVFE